MMNVYLDWFTTDEQFPFFIQYGGHEEDATPHQHADFSELVIVLNGNAMHSVDEEEMFVKKGNVFVINGSTWHGYRNPHDFKICNIMYKPEMLGSVGIDLRALDGYQALFVLEPLYRSIHPYKSKLNLPIVELEHVSALIAGMIREYQEKPRCYQTMLASKFIELVVYLSRQYDDQERGLDNGLMHLASAISYIEDHYKEKVTLEDIAAQAGISVRQLNRVFQAYYKTTPIVYLQNLRLEQARAMLKQTTLSVTDISYLIGFNDSNYLTRQFKKTYGLSPKAFRSQNL